MVSMKPADCFGRASLFGMEALVYCLGCLWIVSPIIRSMMEGMSRYDRPSHQVYLYFFLRSGWQVQFLEPDLKTPLPRKLTFADPEKIRELARRGEAWGTSEARQMLEHAIDTGRGGVYLRLTPAQYAKLKRPYR
jgi:hypothetical protein